MKDIIENSKDSLLEVLDELKQVFHDDTLSPQKKSLQIRSYLTKCSPTKWTIYQETLMELEVAFRTQVLVGELKKLPTKSEHIRELTRVLKENFSDEPELAEILLNSIPNERIMRDWMNRPDWKEEVDKKMRDDALFSPENRHQMIQSIFREGLGGSAKHAEMYLKMSGDLGKPTEKDPVESTFERIQKSLKKG